MINKAKLEEVAKFRTDTAQSQADATERSSMSVLTEYRAVRQVEGTVDFEDETGAVDDLVAIALVRAPAKISWHDIKILADDDASTVEGEVGILDAGGAFVKKATLANGSSSLSDLPPAPDEKPLDSDTWVVIKLKGTVPTSGLATFYIDYKTIS